MNSRATLSGNVSAQPVVMADVTGPVDLGPVAAERTGPGSGPDACTGEAVVTGDIVVGNEDVAFTRPRSDAHAVTTRRPSTRTHPTLTLDSTLDLAPSVPGIYVLINEYGIQSSVYEKAITVANNIESPRSTMG